MRKMLVVMTLFTWLALGSMALTACSPSHGKGAADVTVRATVREVRQPRFDICTAVVVTDSQTRLCAQVSCTIMAGDLVDVEVKGDSAADKCMWRQAHLPRLLIR